MSWQLPTRFTIAKLSAVTTLLLTGSQLNAATISSPDIKSTQYQPLSASITVSDIDPDNFSVSLANPSIYQQMGLNANTPINVRFVKTSANSGRVEITSPQPIAEPFADVVLMINDNGKKQPLPQTLLLPIGGIATPLQQISPTITSDNNRPNLPVVNAAPTIPGTPLQISQSPPPPLVADTTDSMVAMPDNTSDEFVTQSDVIADGSELENLNVTATPKGIDKQIDILKTQIKRTYQIPTGQEFSEIVVAPEGDSQQEALSALDNNNDTSESTVDSLENKDNQATTTASSQTADSNTPDIALGKATYTVQRNDNLWTIASQIARENNLDIPTVMEQIQAYNPDAFFNGKASQLKTNVTLALPDYDVIPSKLGIKAAISARQSQNRSGVNKGRQRPSSSRSQTSSTQAKGKSQRRDTASTARRALPKPQVTLVTPSKSGSATGSQTNLSAAQGNGMDTSIVSQLKATREHAATKAKRVRGLNDQLTDYTQKLQLQNQRLADLEQRLKNLRNN